MKNIPIIETWADSQDLPLQVEASDGGRIVLLVLNGDQIPGEMSIVGQITVQQVNEDPASYAIEVGEGKMILDESWASEQSLPSILTYSLGLLQRRVKAPQAHWALAMVDPTTQFRAEADKPSDVRRTRSSIDQSQLASHDGVFFAVWHEEWESSHAEDRSDQVRFTFQEDVARQEFLRLKERMGTDPDVIRESLGWFRLRLPSSAWDALRCEEDWTDGSCLHPVKSLRLDSAVGRTLQVEVMETSGAALDSIWPQLVE